MGTKVANDCRVCAKVMVKALATGPLLRLRTTYLLFPIRVGYGLTIVRREVYCGETNKMELISTKLFTELMQKGPPTVERLG